jgi:hypothetical protein
MITAAKFEELSDFISNNDEVSALIHDIWEHLYVLEHPDKNRIQGIYTKLKELGLDKDVIQDMLEYSFQGGCHGN